MSDLRTVVARRLGLEVTEAQADRLRLAEAVAAAALHLPRDQVAEALDLRHWSDPAWQAAIGELVVQETCFMRQRPWFDRIAEVLLRPLAAKRVAEGRPALHLWSAACATGEEAWSLAMLGHRILDEFGGGDIHVTATDLSLKALATAKAGLYAAWTMRELGPGERMQWFMAQGPAGRGRRWQVLPDLKRRVDFTPFNLAEPGDLRAPFPGGPFDLIVCRNVLMYLTPAARARAIRHLSAALAPGGMLAVGPAEAVASWFRPLVPHNYPEAILFQRPEAAFEGRVGTVARPSPPPPPLPIAPRPIPARKPVPAPLPAVPVAVVAEAPAEGLAAARLLADQGALEQARTLLEPLAEGGNLDANLMLAMVCSEAGALDAGIAAARRAVYLAPRSPSAQFVHGLLQARRGAAARARRNLAGVLDLLADVPDETELSAVLGLDAGSIRQAAERLLRELADGAPTFSTGRTDAA